MFINILKFYLRATGRSYLIPFIEGVNKVGRPAEVFFPVELLEQGVLLFLSGLNNTMAFQSNPDWVWPYWFELQQNPSSEAFVPTGVNVMTTNISKRNWVSLGVPDSDKEVMVDPVGMLNLAPFGWSVLPYIRLNETTIIPVTIPEKIEQSYKDDRLPCLITDYNISDKLAWKSETMALLLDKEEVVSYSHYFSNTSNSPLELTFGLSIRPYNQLTFGHINKIKFKNKLWRINRKAGLLLEQEPDRTALGDRHSGDPILNPYQKHERSTLKSGSGIATGISEFDLTIAPGETKVIQSIGLIKNRGVHKKFTHLLEVDIEEEKQKACAYWKDRSEKGLNINIPDKELENAFYAVKNRLHIFDDVTHFSPGTFFYHSCWIRDSAFIALAFNNAGFKDQVENKISRLLQFQKSNGAFYSQKGEWDGTGQTLFIVLDYCFRYGDKADLERYYEALYKGWKWIEKIRKKSKNIQAPHAGLMPAGISAEHFGPNDHYFWDNFWSLAGTEMLIEASEMLGKHDRAKKIKEGFEEYQADLQSAMTHVIQQSGNMGLASSPYRKMDPSSIGNLVAVSPLSLFTPEDSWVKPTTDFLVSNYVIDGLFFQSIIHTGFNTYLSLQLAKALLHLQDDRWEEILNAVIKLGNKVYAWPEAVHPRTMGGCMGDGDHGWAAAEFINFVRDMFVNEEKDGLILGLGIKKSWLQTENVIAVKDAVSRYGTVSFEISVEKEKVALSWKITRSQLQQQKETKFIFPLPVSLLEGNEGQLKKLSDNSFQVMQDSGEVALAVLEHEPASK